MFRGCPDVLMQAPEVLTGKFDWSLSLVYCHQDSLGRLDLKAILGVVLGLQGAPFESELEYLAEGCQGDPLVQTAVLSFKQQTALKVHALAVACPKCLTEQHCESRPDHPHYLRRECLPGLVSAVSMVQGCGVGYTENHLYL